MRDPSGELRHGLQKLGAFKSAQVFNNSALELFVQRLTAAGDTVTYVTLTDSTHAELGEEGMKSLLDALVPEAQPSTGT